MYAVIKINGRQYRVEKDQVIYVETLKAEIGDTINFSEVLMVANGDDVKIGVPIVKDAKVSGKVLNNGRHKKIEIIKFKRRKHHIKRQGHRQNYTAVRIESIA